MLSEALPYNRIRHILENIFGLLASRTSAQKLLWSITVYVHNQSLMRRDKRANATAHDLCFTAIAVAGFVDPKTNNFPGSLAAYCSDGASIVIGSLMGTSPVTVFVGM